MYRAGFVAAVLRSVLPILTLTALAPKDIARIQRHFLEAAKMLDEEREPAAKLLVTEALSLWESCLGDGQPNAGDGFMEIGRLYILIGEVNTSLRPLARALKIFENQGNLKNATAALRVAADAWNMLGRNAEALDFYNRALLCCQSAGDDAGEAQMRALIEAIEPETNEKQKLVTRLQDQPFPVRGEDSSFEDAIPEAPAEVGLKEIRKLDSFGPVSAVQYNELLSPLVGESVGDDQPPILATVRWTLLLALQQGAEEVRFDVRGDQCLDIRLRVADVWAKLPPLNCTGSVLSRLLVLGNMEKGEEARSKAQTGRRRLYGVEMVFETEPLGPYRENIRVLIGRPREWRATEREMVCSGCLTVHPESRVHVLPTYNGHVKSYVTTFRCDRCWPAALEQTRARLESTAEAAELASAAEFFERYGIYIPERARGAPAEAYRERLLQLVDGLRSKGLYMDDSGGPGEGQGT